MARGYKTGGRKAGTPNKMDANAKLAAQLIRMYIIDIFDEYKKEQLMRDLQKLSPKARLDAMAKYLRIASKIKPIGVNANPGEYELLELFKPLMQDNHATS